MGKARLMLVIAAGAAAACAGYRAVTLEGSCYSAAAGEISAAAGPSAAACRQPAVAGAFYPANSDELRKAVERCLGAAPSGGADSSAVIGVIAPHAGYAYSGAVAGKAYREIAGRAVTRVVVLGVGHYEAPAAAWADDVGAYRTPLGDVPVDRVALGELRRAGIPLIAGAAREHSIEVQLPFLQVALGEGWRLVPILIGDADAAKCAVVAAAMRGILNDETIVVASSDFTHYGAAYGFEPFVGDSKTIAAKVAELDEGAIGRILDRDAKGFAQYVSDTGATICGRGPITVLLEALPEGCVARQAGYARSGDVTGDYGTSVSYAGVVFTRPGAPGGLWGLKQESEKAMSETQGLTAEEKKTLLTLARRALVAHIAKHESMELSDISLTEALKQKRGAFVTLEMDGRLRGCIGYVEAIKPLWQTVVENAVNAAARDPRFPPVTSKEVDALHIEISAMTPLEVCSDASKIAVGTHGLMVSRGFYRGLLLPQVATEYEWDREEFLGQTCIKAGLPSDAWKDGKTTIETFCAEVFGEGE